MHFNILVVGGGHAGAEAAWAAARMGASVAMVTMQREAIGRMSCNPAIGGLGKGQIVREIDALGGIMGLATDRTGIQFRMLNRSKGPAVWAPRAQCDRDAYPRAVQDLLAEARNIEIIEGSVERIEVREGRHGGTNESRHGGTEARRHGTTEPRSHEEGLSVPRPQESGVGCQQRHEGKGEQSYEATKARRNEGAGPRERDSGAALFKNGAIDEFRGKNPLPHGRGSETDDTTDRVSDHYIAGSPHHQITNSSDRHIATSPNRRVTGVVLADGRRIRCDALILTTGTFLRGLMHCGETKSKGGRVGEAASAGISAELLALGFELGRLKTGTPPRIHRDTIQYDVCDAQPGDEIPTPFSAMTDAIIQRQINCWVTWTNEGVHDEIRANLHRAPMYSGQIQSRGPRYCPSIEDKVVRFADKNRHQVFLEPEGYDNERVYCNGISTSLPADVQDSIIRGIPGLENARILQHGYAVEYDFVPTHQTMRSLETKLVRGLFLAGQINGTSGYEEAAGQGLIAGVSAVRALRNEPPFVLGRDEAYIGVMIDDLVTRPPTEPYRMFTSRAEYRLRLRADNADERLTPVGRGIGTVDEERWTRFERRRTSLLQVQQLVRKTNFGGSPLAVWMRRPNADLQTFANAISVTDGTVFSVDVIEQALIDARYRGYVDRQDKQIERFRRLESMTIPPRIDYASMPELRFEAREQLSRVGPSTLGQAARISGVNPADITVLWIYLTGRRSVDSPMQALADTPTSVRT